MSDSESGKRKADIFGDDDDLDAPVEETSPAKAVKTDPVETKTSAEPVKQEEPKPAESKAEEAKVPEGKKEIVSSLSVNNVTANVIGNTPYFRIYYMTQEMFRDCLELKEIKWKKSSHGHTAPIMFNNTRLQTWIRKQQLPFHVKEKRYSPQRLNNFYFQTVPVCLPYGYSPSKPPTGTEIANKLVVDLASCYDEEEMTMFIAGLEAMDAELASLGRVLFADYHNGICKKDLTPEFLDTSFKEKWKSPFKSSKTLTFALDTIKEDAAKGIDADPYTAKLRVWDDGCKDKPLAELLTRENSCKYDPKELQKKSKNKNEEFPPQNIIIGPGAWAVIGAVTTRFFNNDTCINYQLLAYDCFLKEPPVHAKGNPLN